MWDDLRLNQANLIKFVMVDATYTEVAGLGNTFTYVISKNTAAPVPGIGVKTETGLGGYTILLPATECDTVGSIIIHVSGVGCIQQNLVYNIQQATPNCIDFTYTVTDIVTGLPIQGVEIDISTDIAGANIIWCGNTDAFGVARDSNGDLPCLDAGTVYFWRHKPGYTFVNPDAEVVS